MEKSWLSPSWYRVASLKLRLRAHARFHRVLYRSQAWYVLQDRTSGRFQRFSAEAYLLVALLDGARSLEQVWTLATQSLGQDALTQDEVIRLLGRLHAADVLFGDVPPDIAELAERGRKQRQRRRLIGVLNPLALRLPLLDPDEFLTATAPLARWVFSGLGAVLFLLLLAYAGLLAGQHAGQLLGDVTDHVLAAENLLLLAITYPLVKALHELGHAYAVKHWGGEVHEVGLMFLVFVPAPYVDASDSMSFPSKWQRALVGAAGILVELGLAAIAMIVWVNAEPGLVRAFAFNVMLIGGVSTVLFNGNPLLRFDGYYVLSDLLEIPNLGARANSYVGYLVQRHAFGLRDAVSPVTALGEAPWLFGYAFLSFGYRMLVAFAIALLVGTRFFIIGILIAIWSLVLMIGVPMAKHLRFLFAAPALRRQRGRALLVSGGAAAGLTAVIFALPLPHATLAEGVVWMPPDAALHATADGVVVALQAEAHAQVTAEAPLLLQEDPALASRARLLAGRVAEREAEHAQRDLSDPVRARITLEELNLARADLALTQERLAQLTLRSKAAGQLNLYRPEALLGRFLRKGELVGYVVPLSPPVIQVVVPESEADLVLQHSLVVAVRPASRIAEERPARITRIAPRLEESLPNAALSTAGGGVIALDPSDPARLRTIGRFLHLDLSWDDAQDAPPRFGERVMVRFSHPAEPLAGRLYKGMRQVFLRHFNV
ncbi:MAG: site-2 protease family protein [Roseococcus sp.]